VKELELNLCSNTSNDASAQEKGTHEDSAQIHSVLDSCGDANFGDIPVTADVGKPSQCQQSPHHHHSFLLEPSLRRSAAEQKVVRIVSFDVCSLFKLPYFFLFRKISMKHTKKIMLNRRSLSLILSRHKIVLCYLGQWDGQVTLILTASSKDASTLLVLILSGEKLRSNWSPRHRSPPPPSPTQAHQKQAQGVFFLFLSSC
jgi:uncharacterized Rmd1/YagE family protein